MTENRSVGGSIPPLGTISALFCRIQQALNAKARPGVARRPKPDGSIPPWAPCRSSNFRSASLDPERVRLGQGNRLYQTIVLKERLQGVTRLRLRHYPLARGLLCCFYQSPDRSTGARRRPAIPRTCPNGNSFDEMVASHHDRRSVRSARLPARFGASPRRRI